MRLSATVSRMASHKAKRHRAGSVADWEMLSDAEILAWRVRDLGLRIDESPLWDVIQELYGELDAKGLGFRPPCYLADEWFCPDRIPVIGVPFCLAHPRLMRLEKRMMDEVEGGTPETCMRLLRHECGHAINYAYGLYKRTRWRELFGPFSSTYSATYAFRPYSRHYVLHLDDGYAQAHPDEDFAETFAVWLTPDSNWMEKYAKWPVIRKLRYVDAIMGRIGHNPPTNRSHDMPYAAARMTSTLDTYYERKRKEMGEGFVGYYDDALCRIFTKISPSTDAIKASALLRRHGRRIVEVVTTWNPHRKYDMRRLLSRMAHRCDANALYVAGSEADTLVNFTAFLCAIIGKTLRANPEDRRG